MRGRKRKKKKGALKNSRKQRDYKKGKASHLVPPVPSLGVAEWIWVLVATQTRVPRQTQSLQRNVVPGTHQSFWLPMVTMKIMPESPSWASTSKVFLACEGSLSKMTKSERNKPTPVLRTLTFFFWWMGVSCNHTLAPSIYSLTCTPFHPLHEQRVVIHLLSF